METAACDAGGTIIDAAVRFARTNPELLAYAREAAPRTGRSVDDLLADAIDRVGRERARRPAFARRGVRYGTRR